MNDILCALMQLFILLLFARAVISWFPVRPDTFLATVSRILVDLTDWALRPLRQIIPPAGMFDLSFFVLMIGLIVLHSAIC